MASLQSVTEVVLSGRGTVAAVVGERGIGKTTFLDRLESALGDLPRVRVLCPGTGMAALIDALGVALGLPSGASEEEVVDALTSGTVEAVLVDDAHRIVQPQIGGLAQLDHLAEIVRRSGAPVSWVLTFGTHAWQFVRRARGERATFDQVAVLEAWEEEEIAKLLEARMEDAGLTPSFDGLVIPRPLDFDSDLDEAERTAQAYYRIRS